MSEWSLVSASVTLSGYSAAQFRSLYPEFKDAVVASAPNNITLVAVDITSVTDSRDADAGIVVVFTIAVLNQAAAASLMDALAAALPAAFPARLAANLAAVGRPATNVTVTAAPHVVPTSPAPRRAARWVSVACAMCVLLVVSCA
jgi:hypothetical protein